MPSPPGAGHPLQTLTLIDVILLRFARQTVHMCGLAAICASSERTHQLLIIIIVVGCLASVDTTRNLNGNSTSVMEIAPPKSRPSESGSKRASDGYPAKGGDVMDDFPMAIAGFALRTLHLIVDNSLWSVLWVVLSGVLAHVAGTRGRSRTGWFFLSLVVLSPFISLIILLALPNLRREQIEAERHREIVQALAKINIDASAPATEFSSSVGSQGLSGERFTKLSKRLG